MGIKVENGILYIWSGDDQHYYMRLRDGEIELYPIISIRGIKKIEKTKGPHFDYYFFTIIISNDKVQYISHKREEVFEGYKYLISEMEKYYKLSYINIHKPRPFKPE